MKTLFAILVLLMTSLTASAEVIEGTGDLRSLIADIARTMDQSAYREDSNSFKVPTLAQMSTWRAAIDAVLAGDWSAADQKLLTLAPSYKVLLVTDETMGRPYVVLLEAEVTDRIVPIIQKGWGTFIFDPEAWRELSIQVPHPLADKYTQTEGIEAFLQLGARSLLMAGTHRCANDLTRPSRCDGTTTACSHSTPRESQPFRMSDVAHTPTNMFHQTHREIMRRIPATVAIQLHGEGSECGDVIISNGNSNHSVAPDGNVRRLANNFATGTISVCDNSRPCNLCGTNNVQGRFTNGSSSPCDTAAASPNEQFIHIEQSLDFRRAFTPLIDALQWTF